jgi:hypothetical protein
MTGALPKALELDPLSKAAKPSPGVLSVILVTGAGLLVESMLRLEHVDPGALFDAHDTEPKNALVTLVNETFARKMVPQAERQNAVRKRINFGRPVDTRGDNRRMGMDRARHPTQARPPCCSARYQKPRSFHHHMPMPSQIARFISEMMNPMRHQSVCFT